MTAPEMDTALSDDDLIEGQKIAEAMAERFPNEMNSHKGRLFRLLVVMVGALARDMRQVRSLSLSAMPECRAGEISDRDLDVLRTRLIIGNHNTVGEGDLIQPSDLRKLFAEIERLRALSASPPSAEGWQKIEMAPKDGTLLQLLVSHETPGEESANPTENEIIYRTHPNGNRLAAAAIPHGKGKAAEEQPACTGEDTCGRLHPCYPHPLRLAFALLLAGLAVGGFIGFAFGART